MLCEYQLTDFIAAFDDLHHLRVPVGTGDYVAILRACRGEHLNRSGGTSCGMTSADVLGQHRGDDHVRGRGLPAPTGLLANQGTDLLRDQEFGQVAGDKLMLAERLA